MSRLATDIEFGMAELSTLVRLGYEPDDSVAERDVIDPLRDAPWVRCEDCGHYDHPVFMHRFDEDSIICPSCYWTEETAAHQFAIDAGMWGRR